MPVEFRELTLFCEIGSGGVHFRPRRLEEHPPHHFALGRSHCNQLGTILPTVAWTSSAAAVKPSDFNASMTLACSSLDRMVILARLGFGLVFGTSD